MGPPIEVLGAKKVTTYTTREVLTDVILCLILIQIISEMSLWCAERGEANHDFAAITKLCT